MGEHLQRNLNSKEQRGRFIKHLLYDIEALEHMLNEGLIENDKIRIGAEQEFCLVTRNWRPSKAADKVLQSLNDPHFTTELARYNLEINLDPIELKGDSFRKVEHQLNSLLHQARKVAKKHNTRVVLTGILPTISKNELALDYMTPLLRYQAINERMKELRGKDFELHLRGVDELTIKHDSVLFEACNTSFQMHLQVTPEDFISSYNWAQAISGPVLGISTNSPLLLGRELWSETRIALFQQSIDTRSSSYALKDQQARVTFGQNWAQGSIAEIFKNDISQYPVILAKDIEVDSMEVIRNGEVPKLPALSLYNGTVYHWNRACYGVGGGKPHLRIENRYIPSGPTTLDEMANFAFWVGLMKGRPAEMDDLTTQMDFREAKSNFIKAARTGKNSVLHWMGKPISVRDLVMRELLPIAHAGLGKMEIDREDRERLLRIIESRAQHQTGSQWIVKSYAGLCKKMKQDDALLTLTRNLYENENSGKPIHEWEPLEESPQINPAARRVGHIMSTQLFTVNQGDHAELATSIMKWKDIHHVPVEDNSRNLCGLLTWTHMKKFQAQDSETPTIVADIMAKKLITVQPETEIKKAIRLMKKHEIGCLPVVHEEHLVGIITIEDVIPFDHE